MQAAPPFMEVTMQKPEDIPEDVWLTAAVYVGTAANPDLTRQWIARAILAERERCASIADAVANDDGELMARGYRTSEERASRAAGSSIAKAIRSQP